MPGRAWSEAEIAQLLHLCETDTKQSIAEKMGRTVCSVERKTNELGVRISHRVIGGPGKRQGVARHWTREEETRLLGQIGTVPLSQIATIMGRSEDAIKKRISELGWSLKDETCTVAQLSRIFGLDKDTIRRYRDDLGLKFRTRDPRTRTLARPSGASREDIHMIAQAIIDNPTPNHNMQVSLRRLREIQRVYGMGGGSRQN